LPPEGETKTFRTTDHHIVEVLRPFAVRSKDRPPPSRSFIVVRALNARRR
jgi:hypothetical protein